jgi:hypothetical protein
VIPAILRQGHRSVTEPAVGLYLELLKNCLLNTIYGAPLNDPARRWRRPVTEYDQHTLLGKRGLDNVQFCVEQALIDGVPGDLIETGVWRGGTTILMRAVLEAYGVTDRTVWLADSFAGLPPPNVDDYPHDRGLNLNDIPILAVSGDEVRANFDRYGLLDGQVRLLEGWFRDTLPAAPIDHLAILRLDGDLYESTMDALTHLYPRLSRGGYLIVDDCGCIGACRQAVHDYRADHGIAEPIVAVDWAVAYWRRT